MGHLRIAIGLALVALAGSVTTASAKMASVTTPSRNIGCIADDDGGYTLRCDIRTHSYATPKRPARCDLDYGDSLTLRRMWAARWTCHGDTALPPANGAGFKTLAYGTTWRWGPFRCTSRQSGLTCFSASGYGFVMSRQKAGPIYQQ